MEKIFLIGFMASGKTTVGKVLSEALNWKYIDLDEVIEQRCGKPISDIFNRHGEMYFRNEEKKALNDILKFSKTVVATGGGAPVFNDNLAVMKDNGFVVFLSCSQKTILSRLDLAEKNKRPLALQADGENELIRLMESRAACYKSAHVEIMCDEKRIAEIAQEILSEYKTWKSLN